MGGGVIPQAQAEQMAGQVQPQKQGIIPMIGQILQGKNPFQKPQPAPAQTQVTSANNKFNDLIQWAGQKYQVDPNLIASVITHESQFNPQATSSAGAQGLMQLMPSTAKQYGVTDLYNPTQNVVAGTQHLKYLLQRYQGNIPKAIAAYNAGEGRVDQGQYPQETQAFVPKVMNTYQGLIAPIGGTVTSGFNAPRGDRLHYGGDISSPAGAQFVAPTNLQVTQVRNQMSNSPGGMVWGVDTNTGLEHRFHHVQPGVKVGDTIQQGQPLGTLSNINGPHLDYKVYDPKNNTFIDWINNPGQVVPAQYSQKQDIPPQQGQTVKTGEGT